MTKQTFATTPQDRTRAIIMMVIAAVMFSLGGLFIKLSTWDAIPLNGARSGVSGLIMLLYVFREKGVTWPKFNRNMWLGAAAYALTNLTFMQATKLTTAANAVVLQFAAPVWTILISFFFLTEKPRRSDWITVAIILPAIGLFFADKITADGFSGNIIAIISGVLLAIMGIILREESHSSIEIVVLGSFFATIIGIPDMASQPWDLPNISLILGLGIFQLGIPFILYGLAIRHLTAVEAMIILMLEPILNPILVAIFAAEIPGFWALIGGAIVIMVISGRIWFSVTSDE